MVDVNLPDLDSKTIRDMKDDCVKDLYSRILRLIRDRQKELGITNEQMALWLDIKESNYVRLVEGKCHMDTLRLIQIVIELELDICFMRQQELFVDHVS